MNVSVSVSVWLLELIWRVSNITERIGLSPQNTHLSVRNWIVHVHVSSFQFHIDPLLMPGGVSVSLALTVQLWTRVNVSVDATLLLRDILFSFFSPIVSCFLFCPDLHPCWETDCRAAEWKRAAMPAHSRQTWGRQPDLFSIQTQC